MKVGEDVNNETPFNENSNSNSGSECGSGDWAKNAKKTILSTIANIKARSLDSTLSTINKPKNMTPSYTSLVNSDIIKQSLANNLVVSLSNRSSSNCLLFILFENTAGLSFWKRGHERTKSVLRPFL